MKAFVNETRDGRIVIPGTVIEGRSILGLINQANRLFSVPWQMEIHYDRDKCYGTPDRVITRGQRA